MKNVILTGDRPTGHLHLGHYVGTLEQRVHLQNDPDYDMFIMIADMQALTDNIDNPQKITNSILEVMLDYLAVGIDPDKVIIFRQSGVPQLCELTMYFMNLITVSRLERNPTIKTEIKMRGFTNEGLRAGFLMYPVSQAADIALFNTRYVPAGEDQQSLIELTRDIVQQFNTIYGDHFIVPELMQSENLLCRRLPGTDGRNKMSKSLGNAIFLSDDDKTIEEKVNAMYTDPLHVRVSDPGHIEGNVPFLYLRIFAKNEHFSEYCKDYQSLDEMEEHYVRGGLGDNVVKKLLCKIIQDLIRPIRESRNTLSANIEMVKQILEMGTMNAYEIGADNIAKIKSKIF